jgi:hypothetical protein
VGVAGRRRVLGVAGAAALYALAACLRFWPVAPWSSTMVLHHGANDPTQSVWYLAWVAHAVSHGLNPWFSPAINAPHGANIAANTATPALGVAFAPVTWLLGPVSTYNLLLRLGLAGSAFTMFLFLRRSVTWWPAAVLGGALYGFNSFTLRESVFHLHLEFLVLLPLVLWALDELMVTQRRPARPTGAVLGVLLGLQWLINPEVLVDAGILAALALGLLALTHRHEVAGRLRRAAPGLVVSAVVFAVMVAYPVWFLVAGPGHLLGPTQPAAVLNAYRVDLLSPVLSDIALHAPLAAAAGPSATYALSPLYMGVPLVVATVALAVVGRHRLLVQLGAVMAVVSFVLALGPRLTVDGHTTSVPLPSALFGHLPLIDELWPLRFSAFAWLFVALVVAGGLQAAYGALTERRRLVRLVRPPGTSAAGALLGPAVVVLVVLTYVPVAGTAPPPAATAVPRAAAARSVAAVTPAQGTVLFLPPVRRTLDEPMLWQAQSGIAYRMVGGYVIVARSSYRSTNFPPVTGALGALYAAFAPPVTPPGAAPAALAQARRGSEVRACRSLAEVVRQYHLDTVVLWRPRAHRLAQEHLLRVGLGHPGVNRGGLAVWPRLSGARLRPAVCQKV